MFAKMPEYISTRRRNHLSRIVVVAGLVCLTILGMAGNSPAAYADGIPGGNVSDPVVRAVDIAKPAVVRIITFLNGQLTVHFPTQDVTFPQNSNGYQIVLSGSGTFITAHGEILTADHVVNPPQQDLDQFLQQQAAQDVAAYMNSTLKANPPVTADQVTAQLASGHLRSNTRYDTPQSRVYLSTDYTGSLNVTDIQNIPVNLFAPVDRIEKQSSFTDKDVAIIHVSNMNDVAMVQLGNSSNVQQQDELTIIGFPGNGDIAGNSATDLLTLSVNKVFVSSMKTTDTGAPVIQVGGNVEHGDSGGPALDKNGTIVGIVSFGASGQGNTSFLQASKSASALVQSLGLDTSPGKFQQAWSKAFTDYASNTPGHWHKAQIELAQIATSYPLFKAVKPYLDYATGQAKIEKTPQPQSQPSSQPSSTGANALNAFMNPFVLLSAGFLLLAVLLLFGVIIFRRRRGKKTQATTTQASSINTPPPIMPPVNRGSPIGPSQSAYGQSVNDALTAFGAPPSPAARSPRLGQPPVQSQPGQLRPYPPQSMQSQSPTGSTNGPTVPSTTSSTLVHWPCGHLNRSVARYCSVCGEPAPPTSPARKFEQ